MTNEEKLNSKVRSFVFFRKEGFYIIDLPEATVSDNAERNLGTLKVEDAQGNVVWRLQ